MERKGKLNIPGTKPNVQISQLLVSTGIPALDDLLGGGLPVGGIVLIDEDLHGSYAKVLLKYFLAEGVVNKHTCLVAGLDLDPKLDLVNELPALNATEESVKQLNHNDNKMTIAFRYQNLPTTQKEIKSKFGHYYDLSKRMPEQTLKEADILFFNEESVTINDYKIMENEAYNCLLNDLVKVVKDEKFSLDDKFDKKNILRICIHQLGTPMWGSDVEELKLFLYYLKCIVRKCFGVAMISVPTHLSKMLDDVYNHRLIHISDIALGLQSFAGTKYEKNKSLSDYHGFFHIVKLAAINTLVSNHPGSVEYAFKLKKKKLCIEKLHLPPDLQDSNDEKKSVKPSMGCGSNTKHLLDF